MVVLNNDFGLDFGDITLFILGLSYTIPDSYRSDINLRCVFSSLVCYYNFLYMKFLFNMILS